MKITKDIISLLLKVTEMQDLHLVMALKWQTHGKSPFKVHS